MFGQRTLQVLPRGNPKGGARATQRRAHRPSPAHHVSRLTGWIEVSRVKLMRHAGRGGIDLGCARLGHGRVLFAAWQSPAGAVLPLMMSLNLKIRTVNANSGGMSSTMGLTSGPNTARPAGFLRLG